ncbi:hypothetical protein RHEph03_gp057 [Rhizobium phage RHEph03]|uniref:Uncharacterized protein n=2 Tax=Cuernavacavirus RHEph02 TaxID=2733899 RepID=L7TMX7_9CAUD|nr:hypothetical protein HOS21_gp57 [Rhizobium phage RHEph02]AGC35624.1 hypothetical protein RHEph02_gp057 [Rhizobium phage RHEph02]AGC35684.1 hypothetical protein RHEph03_gp057 [Rhizobium phage RHEph03]
MPTRKIYSYPAVKRVLANGKKAKTKTRTVVTKNIPSIK